MGEPINECLGPESGFQHLRTTKDWGVYVKEDDNSSRTVCVHNRADLEVEWKVGPKLFDVPLDATLGIRSHSGRVDEGEGALEFKFHYSHTNRPWLVLERVLSNVKMAEVCEVEYWKRSIMIGDVLVVTRTWNTPLDAGWMEACVRNGFEGVGPLQVEVVGPEDP